MYLYFKFSSRNVIYLCHCGYVFIYDSYEIYLFQIYDAPLRIFIMILKVCLFITNIIQHSVDYITMSVNAFIYDRVRNVLADTNNRHLELLSYAE